jgi:signal transduction histidine kinase
MRFAGWPKSLTAWIASLTVVGALLGIGIATATLVLVQPAALSRLPLALAALTLALILVVVGSLSAFGARRIRRLLEQRTQLLWAVSHDIRTPLTRLRLRADRLPHGAPREGIYREVERIDGMLQETLSYLRAEQLDEPAEHAELTSLLQTVCGEFSDVGYSVAYRGPTRLRYLCRPRTLMRAVSNIVDNAVRHAAGVQVRLEAAPDGRIVIDIADDGPGIADDLRNKVFEPFFSGDAARGDPQRSGFGLGLTIAKRIVEGHGGQISLLEGAPQGLVVRVLLPPQPGP